MQHCTAQYYVRLSICVPQITNISKDQTPSEVAVTQLDPSKPSLVLRATCCNSKKF